MARSSLIYCIITFFVFSGLFAQNLVINPSFEEYLQCPEKMSNLEEDVVGWSAPTLGTTDYFNSCSSKMGVPYNFIGNQEVKFGNGFAGFYLKAPNNYREYIQGKLSETLETGRRYSLSFYISLAESSKYGVSEIGIFFSQNQIKTKSKRFLSLTKLYETEKIMNFIKIGDYNYFMENNGWMKLEAEFVAEGGENYFTIGNFHTDMHTTLRKAKGIKEIAYYYVDMVSVTPLDEVQLFNDLELEKVYTLKDVKFDTDSFVLTKKSRAILDRLYNELKSKKHTFLAVNAHTDDVGTDEYNINLSENRAQSISNYLVQKGFPRDHIYWKGYGENQPKATNATEKGRQMNRRAEFMLSETPFSTKILSAQPVFAEVKPQD